MGGGGAKRPPDGIGLRYKAKIANCQKSPRLNINVDSLLKRSEYFADKANHQNWLKTREKPAFETQIYDNRSGTAGMDWYLYFSDPIFV